jgi:gamma-glutamyltranspeptidase/glutathione hydrolase
VQVGPSKVLAVAFATAVAAAAALPDTSHATEPTGTRFAVATESDAATRAAMQTLQAGGHAVDAAITAALVLGVVNPTSSGLGGGGFALVWDQKVGKTVVLDFRETAPRGIDPSSLEVRPVPDASRGVMVGVPGEVAGLLEMHRRWGRKTFAWNAGAAIRAADKGFLLEGHMARTLVSHRDWISLEGTLASVFYPNGAPLHLGARVRSPRLAATLRGIGTRGTAAFYAGPVAKDIARAAQRFGGSLSEQDLASYVVVERKPLCFPWEGYEVHTMPPPSAGGLLLAQTLRMHDKPTLRQLGEGSADFVHLLAETFRGAIADRVRAVGDPVDTAVPIDEMLSEQHLEKRRRRIGWDRTHAPQRFDLPEHGTTHLVVVDGQRNVVSLTTTVNRSFGSRIVGESSGVVLNDELDDFTPREFMSLFGEAGGGPNAPRAGARPVSSMTPTVVLRDGKPYLALGGSGGMRIAPNVTQAAIAVLAFDRSASEAVARPRFAVGARSTELLLEPGLLDERAVHDLRHRGQRVQETDFPAAVQMVRLQLGPSGHGMQASGDARKSGLGLVR